jgi:outer membrane protein assembly factor BamE
MRKLLILVLYAATHLVGGCSADHIPFVYRQEIGQGNIVTQDMLARLQPGMSRQQVAYVMGTPLVLDPFRPDEWVYHYSLRGEDKAEQRQIRVHFQGDRLVQVTGDVRPESARAETRAEPPGSVVVPLEEAENPGFWDRVKGWIGLGDGD